MSTRAKDEIINHGTENSRFCVGKLSDFVWLVSWYACGFYHVGILSGQLGLILAYLNGNNAAEGENNIKYANSYPMNWTVKNWFAQDKFESLW